jgi:hypothetical protein
LSTLKLWRLVGGETKAAPLAGSGLALVEAHMPERCPCEPPMSPKVRGYNLRFYIVARFVVYNVKATVYERDFYLQISQTE